MVNTVPSDYVTGTITLTNGSDAFTGTGTGWLAMMFRQGDLILDLPDAPQYVAIIDEVTSNTEGTLTRPWLGPTLTGAYRMRYQWDAGRVTAMSAFLREELGNGNLQAFAALVGSAGGVPVFIGPGAMEIRPATDFVNGVSYDVQVDTLADRAAFDGQSEGFAVLVSDVGDGRSALFSKASNAVGDWTDPAYITGPAITLAVTEVDEIPYGVPPDVTLTPVVGGYNLAFEIPRGMIIEPGTTTTLAPDQPAAVTFVPVTGGYRVDFAIPRGPTGDIDGVTPFWNTRLGVDLNASQARDGLEIPRTLLSYWVPSNLEISEISPNAVLVGMDGGNGFFDGFNSFTYIDVANSINIDTSVPGQITPATIGTNVTSITLDTDQPDYTNFNHRWRIAASQISASGSKFRLQLTGSLSGTAAAITDMWVGHNAASGDVYDFDGTQVQVTRDGASTFSITPGAVVFSDWMDYALDEARDLIVSAHTASGDLRVKTTATTDFDWWIKIGSNESNLTNVTGYAQSGSYDVAAVSAIQVGAVGNATIRSALISTSSTPLKANISAFMTLGSGIMNTDILFFVTRNNGVDFTPIPMSFAYQRLDGSLAYTSGDVTLSGPVGTDCRWQVHTVNSVFPNFMAISMVLLS